MKKQQVKKGKSQKGEKNHKKKEGNAPRDKRIFEIIRHERIFCWEILAYYFLLLDDFIFNFLNYLSEFSKLYPSNQSISIQGCYTIVTVNSTDFY